MTRTPDHMGTSLPLNEITAVHCIDIVNSTTEFSAGQIFTEPLCDLQLKEEFLRPCNSKIGAAGNHSEGFSSFGASIEIFRDWLQAAQRFQNPNGETWIMTDPRYKISCYRNRCVGIGSPWSSALPRRREGPLDLQRRFRKDSARGRSPDPAPGWSARTPLFRAGIPLPAGLDGTC